MTDSIHRSRRGAVRNIALASAGLCGLVRPLGAAEPKADAFALVGDRYHNSDYIRTALGKTLVRGAGLAIDFNDEVSLLNAETLAGYRMLIVFRDGMVGPDGYAGSYPGW